MTVLLDLLALFLRLLLFAIFARSIVSWFPINPNGPIVRVLDSITEPILEPLRRVVPRLGMIDITPMIAILILIVLGGALQSN
jgi:YggT family protein